MFLLLLVACQSDSDLSHVRGAPTVEIVAPAADAVLRQGEGPWEATATVGDGYTPLVDLHLVWALDGVEVEGEPTTDGTARLALPLADDALGAHTLALRVTDSDGDEAEDEVAFTLLGPREAPVVTILSPDTGDTFGTADIITWQGEASDSVTPPGELTLVWSSDGVELPGALSADGVSILITNLPAGVHEVALEATDTDGDIGRDSILVTIADRPIDAEPGDLVFSEVMVDPQVVEDEVGEWVELYNTSGSTLDIGGYSFHDDDVDAYVLEGEIFVAPGDYVVLCANVDAAQNGGVPCDAGFVRHAGGGGLAIANGEDELVLSRPDGTEIDWLHYDDTWYELAIAIGVDPAFQTSGDNDDPSHWCNQTSILTSGGEPGTPGQANDPCPDDQEL